MLVLTTIFIGVMQTLPTTAYIEMIDVWLIFCQLIPFIKVVLLTIDTVKQTLADSGAPATTQSCIEQYQLVRGEDQGLSTPMGH